MVRLGNDWDGILADEWQKPYYKALHEFLKQEYSTRRIYPDMHDIFNALKYTAFKDTKVCIIGQDPYHGPGAFRLKKGLRCRPRLLTFIRK